MKFLETMCAWNPDGDIEVGPWPDTSGWSNKYLFTDGACWNDLHKDSSQIIILYIFVMFNKIVVRDKVNPIKAHNELLKITEYKNIVSLESPNYIPLSQ